MTDRNSNTEALVSLKEVFANAGLRAALAFLNSLTRNRFTSLYRFDGDMLHSVMFYDRECPSLDRCDDIPVLASYCVFVRDSNSIFSTSEARADERLDNHPKQKSVQSYCGVPLLNRDGKMFGTICHFDFNPGHIAALDVELMEHLGTLLRSRLN